MADGGATEDRPVLDEAAIRELLALQSGVIARRQVLEAGGGEHDIRRLVRRREWASVHPGVYVDHTGPLTYLQRSWAAVLLAWPAALCHRSVVRLDDGPGRRDDDEAVIHVAVDKDRHFLAPPGIREHRLVGLTDRGQWNLSPPRVRIEEAVIDLAAEAEDELGAVAELSDAVRARRTTPTRLLRALERRSRIHRRGFLTGVLEDLQLGTCSVLEQAYLTDVERAHGLPEAERQVRDSSHGTVYRDVVYRRFAQVVELDGRTHHSSALDRDRDLDRDLDAAVDGAHTVRLGWGQVFPRACETAARIGRLLQQRGWDGEITRCPRCPVEDGGGSQSAGDCQPPPSSARPEAA